MANRLPIPPTPYEWDYPEYNSLSALRIPRSSADDQKNLAAIEWHGILPTTASTMKYFS